MTPPSDNQPPSFEASLAELAGIVERLESGDIGLAESLACYEQGVRLLKECHQTLERTERRIEILCGFDADGNPLAEPLDDESSLARAEQGEPRSRRRSAADSVGKRASSGKTVKRRPAAEEPPSADVDESPTLF